MGMTNPISENPKNKDSALVSVYDSNQKKIKKPVKTISM